jgi:hypothetical protein
MTADLVVPDRPEELTADWLTAALSYAGHPVVAEAVTSERIGTGQIGANYRLGLRYAGRPDASSAPPTLVAKLAAGDAAARERVKQGFHKEVMFYRHLAPLSDVRVPKCYYADITPDLTSFVLLMEDLAPCVPGRQADGCSPEQADAAVRNLAALHASFWNSPQLTTHAGWLAPMDADTGRFLGELMVTSTDQFVDRYCDRLSQEDQSTLRRTAEATGEWAAGLAPVASVVHGDYRLDNLMFGDDTSVCAVDWQTTSAGAPTRDLAYFAGTSLEAADRRRLEEQLLATYLSTLSRHGVDWPLDQAVLGYRRDMLQGPMITVLGCTFATVEPSSAADDMFLAMARRSCAAIRELDSLSLTGHYI